MRQGEAFIGDLASGSEFRRILSRERKKVPAEDEPPFGWQRTKDIDGNDLEAALTARDGEAEAVVIERALDAFTDHFASVLLRFLVTDSWKGTRRIVCGGGLMEGELGAELLRRADERMRRHHPDLEMRRLHHPPDVAGMVGWAYAAPRDALAQGDGFVAVDIGGTNVRWGIVRIDRTPAERDRLTVAHHEKWCHADEDVDREHMVGRIADGVGSMRALAAADGIRLAPFVGLSCPGVIRPEGRLESGGQNLPGDWSESGFDLPHEVAARLEPIEAREPLVMLHNDAVIQALSDVPRMRDVERWAAVTLGTGLGNCSFRNVPGDLKSGVADA
ncbi:ROK family protein [Aureimonas sp. SK2]|uniref:ROK family protein n=1 Tax=Aureimonas sp. SK2 TaxID=3015992 RepID=UPI002443A7C6|nr:ROK family protein [Aureimonas sp. SK2]